MPEYRSPATLPVPRARGHIEEMPFMSKQRERRRIRVYVPDQMRDGLPVLYVHDGDIVLDRLEAASTLDALIGAGRMPPILVAFIDSRDRQADYEAGSPFRSVVSGEILPLIEARYRASRERRAMMGVSQSTVGALDTCVNGGVVFESCVLIAPAMELQEFTRLLPPPGSRTRFLIEAGSYDIPLITNARALRDQLAALRLPVQYFESPQGHNHTAFRARLPELFAETF
jgi:enterochelin esterase-like enzyme